MHNCGAIATLIQYQIIVAAQRTFRRISSSSAASAIYKPGVITKLPVADAMQSLTWTDAAPSTT